MVEVGADSYKLNYASGRVEEYNKVHALIAVNNRSFPPNLVRPWMPKEGVNALINDASWKTGYSFSNPRVCDGIVELEAASKVVSFSLKIGGKDTALDVVETTMNGFGQCSRGGPRWKETRIVHFSKELNLILGSSATSYDPQGFLFGGGGYAISSLEILK